MKITITIEDAFRLEQAHRLLDGQEATFVPEQGLVSRKAKSFDVSGGAMTRCARNLRILGSELKDFRETQKRLQEDLGERPDQSDKAVFDAWRAKQQESDKKLADAAKEKMGEMDLSTFTVAALQLDDRTDKGGKMVACPNKFDATNCLSILMEFGLLEEPAEPAPVT